MNAKNPRNAGRKPKLSKTKKIEYQLEPHQIDYIRLKGGPRGSSEYLRRLIEKDIELNQ